VCPPPRGGIRHRPLCLRPSRRPAVSRAARSRKPNQPGVYRCRCAGRNSTLGSQTYKAMSAPPAEIAKVFGQESGNPKPSFKTR